MQNCWELKNCGREPGGRRAARGVCPAATATACDGVNRGTNGGRVCWAIAGTFCGGKTRGTFANKRVACMQCDVFTRVRDEEGGLFQLLPTGPERRRALADVEAERDALIDQFHALSAVLDEVSAVVYVADFETHELLYVNRYAADLFGTDVVGKKCYRVLQSGQEGPCAFCTNARLVVRGKPAPPITWEFENTITHRWYLCLDRAIHWVDGRLVRMEVAVDITERKRSEEVATFLADASTALAGSIDHEGIVAAVLGLTVPRLADTCMIERAGDDGILTPVAIASRDGALEALERAWRAARATADVGLCARVMKRGKPELITDCSDAALQGAACSPEQLAILRELRPRSILGVPLVARGRALGVMTLVASGTRRPYDQTDVLLAENIGTRSALALASSELYEAAQRAVHAREEILALVAHDLRNPLNAINLNMQQLARTRLEGAAADDVRATATAVKQSVKRMNRLIEDLLSTATIESGHLSIAREPHEVRALVHDAVEMMAPLAREHGLHVVAHATDDATIVECDRNRLLEVFSNLVGNAIKFTPAGGEIRIRARVDGDDALFAVEDTGPGIDAELLPRVFDRYWQGKRAHRAGAGLGLYIVKGIVEAHGGRVWAESRLGVGTSFFFTIPRGRPS